MHKDSIVISFGIDAPVTDLNKRRKKEFNTFDYSIVKKYLDCYGEHFKKSIFFKTKSPDSLIIDAFIALGARAYACRHSRQNKK